MTRTHERIIELERQLAEIREAACNLLTELAGLSPCEACGLDPGDPECVLEPQRSRLLEAMGPEAVSDSSVTPSGSELIATERERQIRAEGWTPEHDDEHEYGEICHAAIAYASVAMKQNSPSFFPSAQPSQSWPWSLEWWKPSKDPVRNLVKAGALIAAEIDRLVRAKRNAVGPEAQARPEDLAAVTPETKFSPEAKPEDPDPFTLYCDTCHTRLLPSVWTGACPVCGNGTVRDLAAQPDPREARINAEQYAEVAEANLHPHYTSTYCIHDRHEVCATRATELGLSNRQMRCKTCESPCLCACHAEGREGD